MEPQQTAYRMLVVKKTIEENGIRFADIRITYPQLLQSETEDSRLESGKKNRRTKTKKGNSGENFKSVLNAHMAAVAGNFYKYCAEKLAVNERERYDSMTEPNKKFLYKGIKAGMFFELLPIEHYLSIRISATVTRGARTEMFSKNAEVWDLRSECLLPASRFFGSEWKKLREEVKTASGVMPTESSWYLSGTREAVLFTNVFRFQNQNSGRRQTSVFEKRIALDMQS